MRVVDHETRREVRDRRLLALEADNYNDELPSAAADSDDDAYEGKGDKKKESDEEDDDEDGEGGEGKGNKKKKRRNKAKAAAKAVPSAGATKGMREKWLLQRKPRSLEKILDYQSYEVQQARGGGVVINCVAAAARPSVKPPRKFCSVCGFIGHYSCIRCGMRFCSVKCNDNHKETRCMKFAIM